MDSHPTLTNLGHLDWLGDVARPPGEPGHTTYRLADEPTVGVLWTYAERDRDGAYQRIGGGDFDHGAERYDQGAFNADDMSRAAVVYLRHWSATGSDHSRESAYQLLRGLAYLQTVEGEHAGNVVLWMQLDGTVTRSAAPVEFPDPSDSAESCWLARTIWAYGEGYAAFRDADPEFARFLQARLELAIGAIRRQCLVRYGQWCEVEGGSVPSWLIADGAGVTAEAMLGLAAYVGSTGDPDAGRVLDQLAEAVAAMAAGSARSWPFGAVLSKADTRAVWHAWAGLAPAALARTYAVRGSEAARDAAVADAASFTPHLLITGGPDNGWEPAPTDRTQIAYGAHSRVESLLAVAECVERPALRQLAGIAASWFFGNNPAGLPMYDPKSGRTYDGVDHPAHVHRNSGAESTIHGLLAMLALDAHPEVAAIARTASVHDRRTWALLEQADEAPVAPLPHDDLLMPVAELVPADEDEGVDGDQSVLVQPQLEWLILDQPGTGHSTALLRSFATTHRTTPVALPGHGPAVISVNDHTGQTQRQYLADHATIEVPVPPGGFTIIRRPHRAADPVPLDRRPVAVQS